MSNEGPKSAYELAMERLRRKDAEAGVVATPLSEEQRAQIAEVRSRAEARTAELKILHEARLGGLFDPEARSLFESEHRRELQRIADECESKVSRIRERGQ